MNIKELHNTLETMSGARFVSLTYTAKESGEQARHTLIHGANYKTLIEKSLLALELQEKELKNLAAEKVKSKESAEQAFNELVESFKATLNGTQENYTKAGMYVTLSSGLKLNLNDNTLEIHGLAHNKIVLVPGVYPKVNSRLKTIAKQTIRAELPVSKYRSFALDSGNIHAVRLQGEEIVFD